jgi:hypothetical protein
MSPIKKYFTCPFCKETITEAKGLVRCKSCRAFHHYDCWKSNNGCSVYGCESQESFSYRGKLSKLGQWPLNAVIILCSFLASLLIAGILEIQWLGLLLFSIGLLVSGFLFLLAFLNPERNNLTQWMWKSCETQSIYGSHYLWIMAVLFLLFGIGGLLSIFK